MPLFMGAHWSQIFRAAEHPQLQLKEMEAEDIQLLLLLLFGSWALL